MKLKALFFYSIFLGIIGVANAGLITVGSTVYDDVANAYWYSDLSAISSTSRLEVDNRISALNTSSYGGLTNWHLATTTEIAGLIGHYDVFDIEQVFTPSYQYPGYLTQHYYYQGRYDDGGQNYPVFDGVASFMVKKVLDAFIVETSESMNPDKLKQTSGNIYTSAWITAGPVSNPTVPEPASLLLFGLGIIGLAGISKKFMK